MSLESKGDQGKIDQISHRESISLLKHGRKQHSPNEHNCEERVVTLFTIRVHGSIYNEGKCEGICNMSVIQKIVFDTKLK